MKSKIDLAVEAIWAPGYRLRLALTNSSGRSTTCYQSQLPWGSQYSLILVAVITDGPGTVLERTSPIDDPGPSTITINNGEMLTGEIDLEKRFPRLRQATGERDAILFWSYQFQAIDAPPEPRTGAYVLLHKREHTEA